MKKLLIIVFLLIPTIVFAEAITLKSGRVINGEVLEKTEEYIKIDFKGVELTFYNDEIAESDNNNSKFSDSTSFKTGGWNGRALQAINKTKKEFSFVVLGDNRGSKTTFRHIIDKVNGEDISFSINVGDLVNDGQRKKFMFFIKQIENLKQPSLTVIGNHELRKNGRENYKELFGKFYYSFTVGNSYFIILDNADAKKINSKQMDWLKENLKKSSKYKHRFIFMHVPLFDPRKSEQPGHSMKDIKFAKELNRLFDTYNVTMIFTGHIHGYFRGTWGETPYIITGGAGVEIKKKNFQHYFHHYIKVDLTGNAVKYQVIRVMDSGDTHRNPN